ncbi:hypothetical protein EW146_g8218 [Bondarzewia mesenterica]|uniref:Uncharacterized protein n=1 Tax=Bondarzewia mesenterica TaxID=1095465 RepID=A0A4S4LLN1_9AGAM|nr:hypothetical protein EW146_g8218 [Bondarzewia mesenterica]
MPARPLLHAWPSSFQHDERFRPQPTLTVLVALQVAPALTAARPPHPIVPAPLSIVSPSNSDGLRPRAKEAAGGFFHLSVVSIRSCRAHPYNPTRQDMPLSQKCNEQYLVWGPKRPDWMRDNEAIQNYKAEMKAHLLRLRLIRGHPHPNFMHSSPSTSSGGTTNILPVTSAPRIHTFHRQDAASAQYGLRLDDSHIGLSFPSEPVLP